MVHVHGRTDGWIENKKHRLSLFIICAGGVGRWVGRWAHSSRVWGLGKSGGGILRGGKLSRVWSNR